MSTEAVILPTHTPELFQAAVREAAARLRAGELVAVPTETVYGLAANALEAGAVARIFAVKGRPSHNPIIVHVASREMAARCVTAWPAVADRLAAAFWPGPLTLVLPRATAIPEVVTAGGSTVGVRWPNHPFIQALIRECGFPLAAPSANPSNRISPTSAEHVRRALGKKIHWIVDGGPAHVGIESTVLDLTVTPARVLRPGMIHEESLWAVLGKAGLEAAAGTKGSAPATGLKSPGQLPKHYSPRARLVLWSWPDEADLRKQVSQSSVRPGRCHVIAHTRIPSGADWGRVSVIPHDAPAFARAIYAELHRGDEAGAELIVVEALPEGAAWEAIADRLRRAAA